MDINNESVSSSTTPKAEYALLGRHSRTPKISNVYSFLTLGILIGATVTMTFLVKSSNFESVSASGGPVQASQKPSNAVLSAQTAKLLALAKQLKGTSSGERPALISQLVEAAKVRQATLISALDQDPSIVLRGAMSKSVADSLNLPAEANSYIETDASLSGNPKFIHRETFNQNGLNSDEETTVLVTSDGKEHELEFAAPGQNLPAKPNLSIKGLQVGDKILVTSVGTKKLSLLSRLTEWLFPKQTSANFNNGSRALGQQRRLVMLYNFQDNPNNKPWTAAAVQDVFFNQVSQLYQTASYGQTTLTGEFTGWMTIPYNSTDCSAPDVTAAEDGARALGFNPDNYTDKVYISTSRSCKTNGGENAFAINSDGTGWTALYMHGVIDLYSLGHEYGHSLGMAHSRSFTCPTGVTLSSNCVSVEYGEHYDIMGYWNTGYHNAAHRDFGQWFTAGGTPMIQTVTTSGTFTLAPLTSTSTALKSIRIPKTFAFKFCSTCGPFTQDGYYYLEYRQPVGNDSFLSAYPGITNGVLVHLRGVDPNWPNVHEYSPGTHILDMTPTTSGADQALPVGASYTDTALGMTITLTSIDAAGAHVQVTFGTPVCTHANPSVAISPVNQWGAPGQALSYTVSVTNNDSSACPTSSFNVVSSLPSGFAQTPASFDVSVAPGAIGSTTISMTSSSTAADGTYAFTETATSGSFSGNAIANYNVLNPNPSPTPTPTSTPTPTPTSGDTIAPSVSITSPLDGATVVKNKTIVISATASDNVAVTKVEFYVNGSLKCSDTTAPHTCSWKVPGAPNKTYTLQARAYDAAGNVGYSNQVTVTSK